MSIWGATSVERPPIDYELSTARLLRESTAQPGIEGTRTADGELSHVAGNPHLGGEASPESVLLVIVVAGLLACGVQWAVARSRTTSGTSSRNRRFP